MKIARQSDDEASIGDTAVAACGPTYQDFGPWFAEMRKEVAPDFVVAIARGAVRLLQLLQVADNPETGRLISDQALPFLEDSELRGKKILLFDDSLVYGSTMAELHGYLTARGAEVTCAAYAVDALNYYGQSEDRRQDRSPSPHAWLPLRKKHLQFPQFVTSHHSALVELLLHTPLGYNPDFPTYRIRLPKYSPDEIPFLAARLCASVALHCLSDVSLPEAAVHRIWRYTAFLRSVPTSLFPSAGAQLRPHSKVRLTFLPDVGEVRFTPIIQLAIPAGGSFESINFSTPLCRRSWRSLSAPTNQFDLFYHPALSRLLTAFTSLLVGEFLIAEILIALADGSSGYTIDLLKDDLRLTLGEKNGETLSAISTQFRTHFGSKKETPTLPFPESEELPNGRTLRERIAEVWKCNARIRPTQVDLITEAVAKVLLTLKGITDGTKYRESNNSAARLRVGLSCEAIRTLLDTECGIRHSLRSISLALDTCVDSGLAVPKIIFEEGMWFRAFYSGEVSDSDRCIQFKSAFHNAYASLRRIEGSEPLTPYDTQKLCVCLRDLCPFLPIRKYLDTFGACVHVGPDQRDLIDWLLGSDVKEVAAVRKISDGTKELLEVNEYFEECTLTTWTAQQLRDFSEAFLYMGTAFQEVPDDAKLLWSTCCNHRETFSAIAFEAYNWVEKSGANMGYALTSLRIDLSRTRGVQHEVLQSLYWVVQFIAEWRRKALVFKMFPSFLKKLDEEFKRQGGGAEVWWTYVKRTGVLNPAMDPTITRRESLLAPVLSQMTLLTTFVLRVLEVAGVLDSKRMYDEMDKHGLSRMNRHVRWLDLSAKGATLAYNKGIQAKHESLRDHCNVLLPVLEGQLDVDRAWCLNMLSIAERCYHQIVIALRDFCPKYEVQTGGSSFAPHALRRVRKTGESEVDKEGTYVLAIEFDSLQNEDETRNMRDQLVKALTEAGGRRLIIEQREINSVIAATTDPSLLMHALRATMGEGEKLIAAGNSRNGTKKVLGYGSVTIVTRADGAMTMRGASIPSPFEDVGQLLREFRRHRYGIRGNATLLVSDDANRAIQSHPAASKDFQSAKLLAGGNKYNRNFEVTLDDI